MCSARYLTPKKVLKDCLDLSSLARRARDIRGLWNCCEGPEARYGLAPRCHFLAKWQGGSSLARMMSTQMDTSGVTEACRMFRVEVRQMILVRILFTICTIDSVTKVLLFLRQLITVT